MRIRAAPLRLSPQTASSRGFAAFVFTEAAVPLQDLMGDGGMYTLYVGILALWVLLFLLVRLRGIACREAADEC